MWNFCLYFRRGSSFGLKDLVEKEKKEGRVEKLYGFIFRIMSGEGGGWIIENFFVINFFKCWIEYYKYFLKCVVEFLRKKENF